MSTRAIEYNLSLYWNSLWADIPTWHYVVGLAVLVVGSVSLVMKFGVKRGFRHSLGVLLVEYIILIYCITVVSRNELEGSGYNFMPFWSYVSYFGGQCDSLLLENIMNVVVFVPVGVLAGATFRGMSWMRVLVIGVGLSVGIEVMQFVFKKGFSEVDDVMHNTLGCAIGYGLWLMILRYVSK